MCEARSLRIGVVRDPRRQHAVRKCNPLGQPRRTRCQNDAANIVVATVGSDRRCRAIAFQPRLIDSQNSSRIGDVAGDVGEYDIRGYSCDRLWSSQRQGRRAGMHQAKNERRVQDGIIDMSGDDIAGNNSRFERSPRHIVNECLQHAIANRIEFRSRYADRCRKRAQLRLKKDGFDNVHCNFLFSPSCRVKALLLQASVLHLVRA